MRIFICTKTNKIYIECKNTMAVSCFTEYGLINKNIPIYPISNINLNSQVKNIEEITLLSMTHINNIWHLMHRLFIIFKYNKINGTSKNVFLIFFDTFYNRQGDIRNCVYKELIFKGLGYNYSDFLNIYNEFDNKNSVNTNKIIIPRNNINFRNEPMFNDFKNEMLKNFEITRKKSNKNITFILRKGNRVIDNINTVKEQLKDLNINYVYLEDFTIKKQLEIAANTNIMIGIHGAGLTWSIFMNNKSLLIEIYPGNSNTDNYIRWCNIANIKYKRLIADITKGTVSEFRKANVNLNDTVIKEIKNLCK